MASPFPHHYDVRVSAGDGHAILAGGNRPEIMGGPPPEFDGNDRWWSPEHLLLSSVALCLLTTFQAFARRASLAVRGYDSRVHGVLDKTAAGLAFTSISLEVVVKVAEPDRERARQLLDSAKKHCLVTNALKPAVEVTATVEAAQGA